MGPVTCGSKLCGANKYCDEVTSQCESCQRLCVALFSSTEEKIGYSCKKYCPGYYESLIAPKEPQSSTGNNHGHSQSLVLGLTIPLAILVIVVILVVVYIYKLKQKHKMQNHVENPQEPVGQNVQQPQIQAAMDMPPIAQVPEENVVPGDAPEANVVPGQAQCQNVVPVPELRQNAIPAKAIGSAEPPTVLQQQPKHHVEPPNTAGPSSTGSEREGRKRFQTNDDLKIHMMAASNKNQPYRADVHMPYGGQEGQKQVATGFSEDDPIIAQPENIDEDINDGESSGYHSKTEKGRSIATPMSTGRVQEEQPLLN